MRSILASLVLVALFASVAYAGARQNAPQPIRVGGNVKPPVKTKHVNPVYPSEALRTGVQGIVIAEAVIGVDGKVTDVRIVRSVAPLDQAAIEAVRQWEFTPTLLNGVPVPVIMTVTVNFTLGAGPGAAATADAGQAGPGVNVPQASPASCAQQATIAPEQIVRRQAAVVYIEKVNNLQRAATIARQGKEFVPLTDLPGAPAAPEGFDVQLIANGPAYVLSLKDTLEKQCPVAFFSDQTGAIYVAALLGVQRMAPPDQPTAR